MNNDKPDGTPCTAKGAVYEFTAEQLKAHDAAIARKAFGAGRRDKQGCVVNIDYGSKGLGVFEYLTADDYLRAEGLE